MGTIVLSGVGLFILLVFAFAIGVSVGGAIVDMRYNYMDED